MAGLTNEGCVPALPEEVVAVNLVVFGIIRPALCVVLLSSVTVGVSVIP